MRRLPVAAILAAGLSAPHQAAAYTIVPVEGAPGGYVVAVEADLGDLVPFSALPPAFQGADAAAWERGLTFAWQYFRSSETGRAVLSRASNGVVSLSVDLSGEQLADGDTLGAAFVLMTAGGLALHTAYVAARVEGTAFEGGAPSHRVRRGLDYDGARWDEVGAVMVFTMKYYAVQTPDAEGVRAAMRRVVERATDGRGSSEWLGAEHR